MKRQPEQFKHIMSASQFDRIAGSVLREIESAERSFPNWPVEINHGVDIVLEEAGEVAKSSVDLTWGRTTKGELKKELIQTATMCIRMLAAMEPKTS